MNNILTTVTFLPLAGVVLLLLQPREEKQRIRWIAFATLLLDFVASISLFINFDSRTPDVQFSEMRPWLPDYGINYHVGIDGISLFLVLLTTFLGPIVALSTFSAVEKRVKEFMIFLLLLQTGMLGAFVAQNLFLFYVFWEAMLIPMYFLIGVWGGERRVYAAVKFFLFTMVGSVLMLVAILALYWLQKEQTGSFSFEYADLYRVAVPRDLQMWMLLAFGLAFAIKVPMFPFHTWLPDAHVEAPTAGSVILAGVLLKMGTYGFIRLAMPIFPEATYSLLPVIWVLSVIGIVYGALVAMVQEDVKKLVAYSSVSHLGFCMLGLFAMTESGVTGSLLQMVNHGVSTGALFLLVGIIYERRHTRLISEFGGLTKVLPVFAVVFMIVTLSSIGLPGTNGFVGEFLILAGTFMADLPRARIYTFLAATGVILSAVYMLWMFQRVMFGPVTKDENKTLTDMNWREIAYMAPLVVCIFWIGLYPATFTSRMEASVKHFVAQMEPAKPERMAMTWDGFAEWFR